MWQRGALDGTKMKTIAVYEGRMLAVGENDKICQGRAHIMIQGDFSIH
jgi:hypothetical protein